MQKWHKLDVKWLGTFKVSERLSVEVYHTVRVQRESVLNG